MKKRMVLKVFIYFLSVSFLLLMNDFPRIMAAAADKGFPIGEMVSKGEVSFEARENVWKKVEPSHFPVFQGTKIKTEKGTSILALTENCQIEVGQNSLLTFDQNSRLHLLKGSIDFRIPAAASLEFKVGNIFVLPSRSLQASKSPSVPLSKIEEAIGSILIHANGAVTVKSLQGSLSVVSQDRVVLAALSPMDSVTIPSATAKGPSPVMVAQATQTAGQVSSKEEGGIPSWVWIGGGFVLAGVAGGLGIAWYREQHEHKRLIPFCP